ncbi:MAG: GntR family transcriptional regulator [Coriobacteriaceae bacterium]|nr:GntR family transcriptional regulator [Coriobacteriaceae bacterium]
MAPANETIFEVNETSDLPIWAQLRNRLSYLIRTGYFKPGEQLPSVRSMAASAMINYNTVTKAYRAVEDAGLIDNVRGRGMFVSQDIEVGDDENVIVTDSLLNDCIRRYRAAGMSFSDIEKHLIESVQKASLEAEVKKKGSKHA